MAKREMIKRLKIIVSLMIVVCMFLPLSQCSMQTFTGADANTGEVVSPPETINKNVIVSELLFGEGAEVSFESLLIPITFFVPLIFSLLPNFSSLLKVSKLVTQTLFSLWFVYASCELVFIGSPLKAGWALVSASCLFFILCFAEIITLKHDRKQSRN